MKVGISKRNIFFLYMLVFTALAILYLFHELDLPVNSASFSKIFLCYSIFDLFLFELFVLLFLGHVLLSGNIVFRSVLYVLSSLFIFTYYLQIISVNTGREFISRLAVENMDHLYLLLSNENIIYAIIAILTCLMLVALTEMSGTQERYARKFSIPVTLLLLLAILVTSSGNLWLPRSIIQKRDGYLMDSYMQHTSPIASLYSVIFLQTEKYSEELLHTKFSFREQKEIENFGFHYDPTKKYPLIKDTIYKGNPPFQSRQDKNQDQTNVIVIFSEGVSARVIGAYHPKFHGLTPNLDDFARSSMIVGQYYNHTAATYRGLHGQLCSLYPTYGGNGGWQTNYSEIAGKKYLSLADLFAQKGYETIFLDSHHKNHPSRVDEMIELLGFSTVVTGDALATKYISNATPLLKQAYSDRQYFESIIGYLKEREVSKGAENPFFMALYNFGTHPFLRNSRDGKRYGDGSNRALNNFHNFDDAFGRLWEYIKSSSYNENTVIILTADHSHYQEKSYVAAFDEPGYQKIFIDTIPLIIHDPVRELPKYFDAQNSSSIDFAPSLAHYFGLENSRNPFMGTSIFEENQKKYSNTAVACIGRHELFLIDKARIHKLQEKSKYSAKMKTLDTYITIVKHLEMADKIWDGD
jgi:phosphoglycerol transferase MdoB-like AlkP superfamily enzyme